MDSALRNVVDELSRHAEVTVFTGPFDPSARIAGVRFKKVPCIPVHQFCIQTLTFILSWAVYRFLTRVRARFDVVYSTSILFGGSDIAAVNFNSTAFLRELRHMETRSLPPIMRLKHLHGLFAHGITSIIERRRYRGLSRRGDALLLPVSEGIQETLRREFALDPAAMRIVPNPVDTERFMPGEASELREEIRRTTGWDGGFIMLFVGGAWLRKGLATAVEALREMPSDVRLLVVGAGTPSSLDVEQFYRISDVFILPSRFEAQPLVCLEALATGLPLLVRRFPGAEGFLQEKVTGFFIDTPRDIAEAVAALRQDPELYRSMSLSARKTAMQFSKAAIGTKLMKIIAARARRPVRAPDAQTAQTARRET
jgi:UDP-glucose:(heptosyl)LPS alpha-1,3-glucosyltransferase